MPHLLSVVYLWYEIMTLLLTLSNESRWDWLYKGVLEDLKAYYFVIRYLLWLFVSIPFIALALLAVHRLWLDNVEDIHLPSWACHLNLSPSLLANNQLGHQQGEMSTEFFFEAWEEEKQGDGEAWLDV